MLTADIARSQLAGKNRPKVTELDDSVYDRPPLRIFNVYNKQHEIPQSYKTFIIPACVDATQQGHQYSEPCVIPGMVRDYAQVSAGDDFELSPRPIAGRAVVDDIFDRYDLAKQGCFWTMAEKPTRAEIDAAKATLVPFLDTLIVQADGYYNDNKLSYIGAEHRNAARYRNQQRPWLHTSVEMNVCPHCGVPTVAGTAFCPNGDVLDEVRARKARPWLFEEKKAS
jgi:hypothetical protein